MRLLYSAAILYLIGCQNEKKEEQPCDDPANHCYERGGGLYCNDGYEWVVRGESCAIICGQNEARWGDDLCICADNYIRKGTVCAHYPTEVQNCCYCLVNAEVSGISCYQGPQSECEGALNNGQSISATFSSCWTQHCPASCWFLLD